MLFGPRLPRSSAAAGRLTGDDYRFGVPTDAPYGERVRAAEVVGALCLATDLGMGFPFEHGLQTTLIAVRLAEQLGADSRTTSEAYYASLLAHSGCTTEAWVAAEVFGGSRTTHLGPVIFGSPRQQFVGIIRALPTPDVAPAARAAQVARRLPRAARLHKPQLAAICEVAQTLSEQLGLPESVQRLFRNMTERWDGKGVLGRAERGEIPLSLRITHVAMDAAVQGLLGGNERVVDVVRERAGQAFDPEVAACLIDDAEAILDLDAHTSAWEEALNREPRPWLTLEGEAIDRALMAMAGFTDLISPHLTGHSTGVAELGAAAAAACRLERATVRAIRHAGFVHDIGRVAVAASVWEKEGPLTVEEWERVRLHPYYTERVLCRSPFLAALAPVAAAHHERLDGSGYHRGASGSELPLPARLLAAADAFHAMTEPRPHRPALGREQAARTLADEVRAGRLDADAVSAVIDAAGQPAPRLERPAGLTEREVEVIRLAARGLQTKQIARALSISAKTADHHIQNAYGKLGVSTRAAATLMAMEHGLVAWGELPMVRPPTGS
jgi:HD-GYP domain-containing protein (c-di-GMP phosphodiesterase class II)